MEVREGQNAVNFKSWFSFYRFLGGFRIPKRWCLALNCALLISGRDPAGR